MNRVAQWWLPAVLVGAVACGGGEQPGEVRPAGEPRAIPAVRVADTGAGALYRAPGVVRALRRAELATRGMGRIDAVHVRAGDRVRAGQVLVALERGSQLAAGQQARAGLDLAQANLRRVERLYADSAVPIAQLEAARAAFSQAEGQAQAAQTELGYAELVAPFAGVVTARLADPGDLAAPGQPIVVVEDEGAREIVVAAPASVAGQLRAGQTIAVEIGSEATPVSARVAAVVPAADPMSRTVEVRLTTADRLVSNLTAVALLPVAADGAAPARIPTSALVQRDQLTGAFVFAPDSTVRLRWLRLGRRVGEEVEVVSGLLPGDLVARGAAGLRDGEPARPVLESGAAQ